MTEPLPPAGRLETAVSEVLSGPGEQVARIVADAALLLACTGFPAAADELATAWAAHDERPLPVAGAHALAERAWAMLWAARGERPAWADAMAPLDLDAEERAHRSRLERHRPAAPRDEPATGPERPGLPHEAGGERETSALEALERFISGSSATRSTSPAAVAANTALAAELAAADGQFDRARQLLADWAGRLAGANRLPDLYTQAACRHVAPLLLEGAIADALGVDAEWARNCAGELRAALTARLGAPSTASPTDLSWPELVGALLTARGGPDLPVAAAPPPAPAARVRECERRLGVDLPPDYREFLRTADGLPADVVFPALLGADELDPLSAHAPSTSDDSGPAGLLRRHVPAGTLERAIRISEFTDSGVIFLAAQPNPDSTWTVWQYDWMLGPTVHDSFRELLASELALLRGLA